MVWSRTATCVLSKEDDEDTIRVTPSPTGDQLQETRLPRRPQGFQVSGPYNARQMEPRSFNCYGAKVAVDVESR